MKITGHTTLSITKLCKRAYLRHSALDTGHSSILCHYAEIRDFLLLYFVSIILCRYAECHYAKCHGAQITTNGK
jgi:hypothetical protein